MEIRQIMQGDSIISCDGRNLRADSPEEFAERYGFGPRAGIIGDESGAFVAWHKRTKLAAINGPWPFVAVVKNIGDDAPMIVLCGGSQQLQALVAKLAPVVTAAALSALVVELRERAASAES